MQYLKLGRSRLILISFLAFAVLVTAFPVIDLTVSRFFYDGRSFLRGQWWQELQQKALMYFLWLSMAAVIGLYVYNRVFKGKLLNVDGRRTLFVILVLVIGPGLIVNVGFKDNFGRARPRNVVEFGGTKHFTPAFVMSRECDTNCSFSSGDAAGAFFTLTLAMALSRRRAAFAAALAAGVLVSFCRISSGAHFFSDTVTSFFVMLIVSDVLFYYLVLAPDIPRVAAAKPALGQQAPATP
jgi:lipid A 4'-phosphatase